MFHRSSSSQNLFTMHNQYSNLTGSTTLRHRGSRPGNSPENRIPPGYGKWFIDAEHTKLVTVAYSLPTDLVFDLDAGALYYHIHCPLHAVAAVGDFASSLHAAVLAGADYFPGNRIAGGFDVSYLAFIIRFHSADRHRRPS